MPCSQVGPRQEKSGGSAPELEATARWQSTAVRVGGVYLEYVGRLQRSMVYSA